MIRLKNIEFRDNTLSCEVQLINLDSKLNVPTRIYFRCDNEAYSLNSNYDALLVAILPLAMSIGQDVDVEGAVDGVLLENILEVIALYHSWYGAKAKVIRVTAEQKAYAYETISSERPLASFYSGGVDSLFNISGRLNEGLKPVDACILVRGMDVAISDEKLWNKVKPSLQENLTGLPQLEMITVETNAREFQQGYLSYPDMGFGAILGAISNFIAPSFSQVVIGSYDIYRNLTAHASGPLVDRLWSSALVGVVHYTPRYSRMDKLALIKAHNPDLLRNLRVCWKNQGGAYNCGICEKCLRTKVELAAVGACEMVLSFGSYDLMKDINKLKDSMPMSDLTLKFWKGMAYSELDDALKKKIKDTISLNGFYILPLCQDTCRVI